MYLLFLKELYRQLVYVLLVSFTIFLLYQINASAWFTLITGEEEEHGCVVNSLALKSEILSLRKTEERLNEFLASSNRKPASQN